MFKHLSEQDEATEVNLTSLTVLIVTDDNTDKTIMHPNLGTWTKGRDTLPAWIIESAKRMDSVEKNKAEKLAKNWDEDDNEIPPFPKFR